MQNAARLLLITASLAALAGCSSNGDQQDNRDNAIEVNSSAIEVDTLPADENSAAATGSLTNQDSSGGGQSGDADAAAGNGP